MKKIFVIGLVSIFFVNCGNDDGDTGRNYKQDMRDYVIGISRAGKIANPNFIVIPQNGIELVTENGEKDGSPAANYLAAIDGNGQEDLFYGYDNDDIATPPADNQYIRSFLDLSKNADKTILVTDYCFTPSKISDSYSKNATAGYVSYAAARRELDIIPATVPPNSNATNITLLNQAKNFLYLINPEGFTSKTAFINAVAATNYDVVIMDLFYNGEQFTASEIAQLHTKANGGRRLVICYMSIGEAENYRYYWQTGWDNAKPNWVEAENPDWPGNYKVKYWNEEWQGLIYKNQDS